MRVVKTTWLFVLLVNMGIQEIVKFLFEIGLTVEDARCDNIFTL